MNAINKMHFRAIASVPAYEVGEDGRVWSSLSGRYLKPRIVNGYAAVTLCDGNKRRQFTVHMLVLSAFVGERPVGFVCNHKNGIRTDNRVDNLEWVTQSDNVKHAYDSGLRTIDEAHRERCAAMGAARKSYTDEQARSIVQAYCHKRGQITSLAKQFGLSRDTVANIISGGQQ